MKSSNEIRSVFFDFFKEKGHQIVPSAPIVVKNDPTLLFTNAGMNQFKDYFLGNKTPQKARVADSQKCLRVSGKHNDLEEVGVDHYHHTMFEMLGNWSFGNATNDEPKPYFKEEAIALSWELLTEKYGINKDDLYITVFGGDEKDQMPADNETIALWKKWVQEDHILSFGKKENFWEMGDTGPCGPCTEIHYDARSEAEKQKISGRELVNQDHQEVIEIWNLVFIQYNRKADKTLEELPAHHVDTGMGFERLVRILQHKNSNYDTDIFSNTIKEIERISTKKYTGTSERKDIAFRVVADHIRAVVFPIADGQLPSNTGAGYVIRRILRRAIRYYVSYLDIREPLLHKLVPLIANQFEDTFPEVKQQESFLSKVILEEENSFLRTLDSGLKRIENILDDGNKHIDGATAFELFDTFGFPIDLTQLIASENGADVDMEGFDVEMQKQKNRSRAAAEVEKGDWVILQEGETIFTGYDELKTDAHILRYRKTTSKGKDAYQIVLDKSPFYGEMGGQVGDTGILISGNEKIKVLDTKHENDLLLHFTTQLPTDIALPVTAEVDRAKRERTVLHHSATHLLHVALRKVLGTHVAQKGSLVNSEYLRFDFSHFAKVTDEELLKIEQIVNSRIRHNDIIQTDIMSKDEAVAMGAMALFGEKYGSKVRVVSMDKDFSIELCGGTHARRTGDLGYFKITNETAVGAGVRRIEAIAGEVAEKYIEEQINLLQSLKIQLKNPKDPVKILESLLTENHDLKKKIEKTEQAQVVSIARSLMQESGERNGINFIGKKINIEDAKQLRPIGQYLQQNAPDIMAVAVADISGKAGVMIYIPESIQKHKKLQANKIIKSTVAPLIKGGGGGNEMIATAGGQDVSRLEKVLEEVEKMIK